MKLFEIIFQALIFRGKTYRSLVSGRKICKKSHPQDDPACETSVIHQDDQDDHFFRIRGIPNKN